MDHAKVVLDCFYFIRHSEMGVPEIQECSYGRICALKGWQHFEQGEDGERRYVAESRKLHQRTKPS